MNSRNIKFLVLTLCILIVTFIFSACGEEEIKPSSAVCILYGNTKNVAMPNDEVLLKDITQMADNKTDCSVIVIDGKADYICYKNVIKYPDTFWFIKDNSEKEYLNKVICDIKKDSIPKTDEINIINSLFAAEKVLSKTDIEDKKIILFSSGISTDGILDFSKNPNLLNEKAQNIVEMLKENKSLPDLEGISIIWHGLGVVEPPQESLTITEQQKLKKIWETILKACNVNMENSDIKLDIGNMIVHEHIDQIKGDFPMVSIAGFLDEIVFREENIKFKEESAEFKDRKKAENTLSTCVKLLKQSNYKKFYIIGSTASDGDNQGCANLSEERAQAVKDVLVELGVPNYNLKIYGIGREDYSGEYKWRVNDLDKNGKLIPKAAESNRKVLIVKANSKAGKEFKKLWNEKHK
ncbi:MAG: OmpA family protein [Eubacterium sp.]|nr:OmpA family protein [Eubacterium sp.]